MRKTTRRFITSMLSCLLCLFALPAQTFASSFSDVDSSSPYYSDIYYLSTNNYMVGYASNGLFGPDDELTRADAAVVLQRICFGGITSPMPVEYTEHNYTSFTDIQTNLYYTAAVNTGYEMNFIKGYDGGRLFCPNNPITREELITLIYRCGGGYPTGTTNTNGEALARCIDASEAASWAKTALSWALDVGILTVDDTESGPSIRPTSYLTRGEAAAIFTTYIRNFAGKYYSDPIIELYGEQS
jgi:hypothetical protein